MECWEPSAISLETPVEGHVGVTGADESELTSGSVCKAFVPEGSPPPAPKVPGTMCWREGCAGELALPLRTASGPQSHALRDRDDHFPEQSHSLHTTWIGG